MSNALVSGSVLCVFCTCVHTEILDFGYPQNSETGALKTFITQQGIKGQVRLLLLHKHKHGDTHLITIEDMVDFDDCL